MTIRPHRRIARVGRSAGKPVTAIAASASLTDTASAEAMTLSSPAWSDASAAPTPAAGSISPRSRGNLLRWFSTLTLVALLSPGAAAAQVSAAAIDEVFTRFTPSTPGCAIGIERQSQAPVLRAYGSADLEHASANSPDTIFEAGSVSKQFTAAAVLLLVQDGQLSLKDDVRKFLPELPDYGTPITVAELLSHTSGLRDWGEVEDVAGWSRGERVYSLKDVLRITSEQTRLNYRPGAKWSYTNTGYNLAAIMVERVSGKSLAAFTQKRLFAPLGMSHTQWRDDFRRVVPGRAIAYEAGDHGYAQDMPFENAYGNGGLLTTVGDLLIWNRALDDARLGPLVTAELQRRTVLTGGRTVDYARGLFIQRYRGAPEIAHAGATAGYRAWLGRYPDQHVSIALLCNAGDVNPVVLAHTVANLYLPAGSDPAPLSATVEARLASRAGWYADDRWGEPMHLVVQDGRLKAADGPAVEQAPDGRLLLEGREIRFLANGAIEIEQSGDVTTFARAEPFGPTPVLSTALTGRYRSEEADATYEISREKDGLHLRIDQRPDADFLLTPAYRDAFTFADNLLRLVRGKDGGVAALRVSSSRLWDLQMNRVMSPAIGNGR